VVGGTSVTLLCVCDSLTQHVVLRASVRRHRRAHDVLLEKSAAFDVQRKRADSVGEICPVRLAPRIRLPGVLQLPQVPAKRPSMRIRQQYPAVLFTMKILLGSYFQATSPAVRSMRPVPWEIYRGLRGLKHRASKAPTHAASKLCQRWQTCTSEWDTREGPPLLFKIIVTGSPSRTWSDPSTEEENSTSHIDAIGIGRGILSAVEFLDPISSDAKEMTSQELPKSEKPIHDARRFRREPRVAVSRMNTTKVKRADVRSGSQGMRKAAIASARSAMPAIIPESDNLNCFILCMS
jgi:hypothetical protein